MVEILKLMLGRDSEDEIWSRLVFELVIWTQPSGPLCLWQCLMCDSFSIPVQCERSSVGWISLPGYNRGADVDADYQFMILLASMLPCMLRSRDNNAGPSVAVPRVSVGLASKLELFLNFQSIFCGTMIEIRCLCSFHKRFNDYRSFSVKESVLFYWCKALSVPRHPAMLRGA